MNEVEKMYENAKVEKQEPLFCEYFNYSSRDLYERCMRFHKYCADGHFGIKEMCPCGLSKKEHENMFKYPPFTAGKQIKLIKWLGKHKQGLGIDFYGEWSIGVKFEWEEYKYTKESESFEEALAGLINNLWQDLTEEERKQIKEILSE